jgi:hypothetical protein
MLFLVTVRRTRAMASLDYSRMTLAVRAKRETIHAHFRCTSLRQELRAWGRTPFPWVRVRAPGPAAPVGQAQTFSVVSSLDSRWQQNQGLSRSSTSRSRCRDRASRFRRRYAEFKVTEATKHSPARGRLPRGRGSIALRSGSEVCAAAQMTARIISRSGLTEARLMLTLEFLLQYEAF